MKRQILCCFLLSSLEEAENDFQAENILEAMEVDNVPDATAKEERIAMLEAELEREKQKSLSLQNQLTLERFGVARFSNDNKLISFYTGFATYSMFRSFYECIEPTAKKICRACTTKPVKQLVY